MKSKRLFTIIVLALGLTLSGRAQQRVEQQSFTLPANGTVKVQAYRGLITVSTSPGDKVELKVRWVSTQDNAQAARVALDGLQLRMSQVGSTISLIATNPRETGLSFDFGDRQQLGIYYELVVPEHCNLDLTTGNGGIAVDSMSGRMKAKTVTGTISFRQIDGSITARTEIGDILVSRCTGEVNLQSVQGNLSVGTVGGRATLETANGDIELMNAYGEVQAKAAAGNIIAGFARIIGPSSVTSSLGNVTATINPAEKFSLNAQTRWGKIYSKLPLAAAKGGIGQSRLTGDFQGGGPQLNLASGGGKLWIESAAPLFEL
ncbi:MAG: DUF4097 family beta strand repeat-containing protein [Cephaloticoccus sp.]|nr:DUF4097 family beta strand repeat-containing protein [Cephaloticoccus sp.]MCF7760207.1 DUF4097 family beta strand repeat-containing protein [Cephaloticoccus sp.]